MKAAIYTIFLWSLYLKTICPYLFNSLYQVLRVLAEGMLYSVYAVLALRIELIGNYSQPVSNTT